MKKFIVFTVSVVVMACNPLKNIAPLKSMESLTYKYDVKKVEVEEGLNIAYIDEGKGTPVIFVHGLGSYIPAWRRNIEVLSKNFRCIAIDLPGYGKSDKPAHSGKMTYYASVIMKFANKLGLEEFSLAGHSMGGQISMITALENPSRVKKLILVDPAGFERFHEGQKQWFREVMTPNLVKLTTVDAIQTNLAYNFYKMPKEAQFMIDDRIAMRVAADFENYCYTVAKSVEGMVDEPVIDILENIKQPTLIFFGSNDNLIPNRYLNPGKTKKIAMSGHKKIKGSTLIMVDKAGHFMMFEKPGVFNSGVIDFMK